MKLSDFFNLFKFAPKAKKTPADFRRNHRKVREIGRSIDTNSKHVGIFTDKIKPIKRRFHGVSRTANK